MWLWGLESYHSTFINCDPLSDSDIATFAVREFLVNERLSKSKQGKISLAII